LLTVLGLFISAVLYNIFCIAGLMGRGDPSKFPRMGVRGRKN